MKNRDENSGNGDVLVREESKRMRFIGNYLFFQFFCFDLELGRKWEFRIVFIF